ncbi:MAG: hypothetical protein Q4F50_06105 [Bacteroides sp.]|uniref:hypothetical protein n=1 Tax=Bacteroides sp. TaxID=29523 RepID=UPI0026DFE45A|nr:hypothetical protein [Bacteroides sp.]MDO5419618.1 hypothetical protein [Bacteroides sp.]
MMKQYLSDKQVKITYHLDKDVVLWISHSVSKTLVHKYFRMKEQVPQMDVILLLDGDCEKKNIDLLDGVDFRVFNVDMLNALGYEPIEETLIPGSNHFVLLWFFLHNSQYRHYWNIEYDVDFTGDWNLLFRGFQNEPADFISTHIQTYEEVPNWYWWSSYHGVTLDVPLNQRIRSFNPIYRISLAALGFLNRFLKEGNSGHHEVLIPTVLYSIGLKILDFGGDGSFILPQYKEKFYLSSAILPDGLKGTMRDKPNFNSISSYHIFNKLFHPVKKDCWLLSEKNDNSLTELQETE